MTAGSTKFVSLNTVGMSHHVSVYLFQFGDVPADNGSFLLTAPPGIPAGSKSEEVFWFERNPVKQGFAVRFDLRFELDIHNSVHVQVRLEHDFQVTWRWYAPLGVCSDWSTTEQQAPWSDDGHNFCVNINPISEDMLLVSLSECLSSDGPPCKLFPPQQTAN
jgi:hypothetical protein